MVVHKLSLLVKEASDINVKAMIAVPAHEEWLAPRWLPAPSPGCHINIPVSPSQVDPLEVLQRRAEDGSLTHSESSYRCKLWLIFLSFSQTHPCH